LSQFYIWQITPSTGLDGHWSMAPMMSATEHMNIAIKDDSDSPL